MKKLLKIIAFLAIALIALGIVIGMMGDGSSKSADTATSTATTEPAEPPLVVNAKTLIADYKDNEVAADQKYKGKVLEVSGKVAGIDSGMGDEAVVRFSGPNDFESARASGDDDFTKYAATLKKGQQITLICKSDGEVIGSPTLKECKAK